MLLGRASAARYLAIVFVFSILVLFLIPHRETRPALKATKSSFDWSTLPPFHDPAPLNPLPSGKIQRLPPIQHNFPKKHRFLQTSQQNRRDVVKKTFQRNWKSYKEFAWMKDELAPLSATGKNTFGGWAATLVDSLDTLWIMDLKQEFWEAVQVVAIIDWADTQETACNLFETTIRHLGGLLAAYQLSGEPVLLEKAVELGNMLYAGFDTPNRMPAFWLDFEKAKNGQLTADTHQPSAGPGSLSMEFTRLSQLTGDPKYYDAISRVSNLLYQTQNATMLPGMWPTFFNMREGILTQDNTFTLGALADSLYEYLLKMHALLGGADLGYAKMYLAAAETIKNNLLYRPMTPNNDDILFIGTFHADSSAWLDPEGQHLTCFTGGMFALGGRLFNHQEHIDIGAKLTRGCIWAYKAFPTGIMPEIFSMVICGSLTGCVWDEEKWEKEVTGDHEGHLSLPKGFRNARVPSYSLRPEAIESAFVLYRITGLEEFQTAAWDMFQAIEAATHTPYGNAAIDNVTVNGRPSQRDSMESFWLAETLKYLYLIFSPSDLLSLDDWVFNTEAHPLRIMKP
ncbi:uncharacterized protein A1O9_01844 [Exophiala aquamarina CBS 119918]|uniref:alpha-1,2-Mannosidase n=1 Tax=Exophiala aquamarina CBS 119918 TaxID=1182545 RepID=A0A072PVH6_9EURO|nr:uncharacterized protein A1O9_01844 [Exophiala aquamarina CBS 119918]KEF63866.1 hypothetical protein A1O9_01844 [Exophiala aquamarina CBS 119918]